MNNLNNRLKFWGLEVEEIMSDSYTFWRIFNLRSPFYNKGLYWIGINIKLLNEANRRGVSKLYINEFEDGIEINLPSGKSFNKFLKQKDKDKEYQLIPSKFEGAEAMKVYLFCIGGYKGIDKKI